MKATPTSIGKAMHYRFEREHIAFFSSGHAAEIRAEYRKQAKKYADSLRIQTALRSQWSDLPPALLAACMAQFALQDRAAEKCVLPDGALLTSPALEMASSAATAALHASLLPPDCTVLEIAAGIGADSVAIAARARALICIESDDVHARMLSHNLALAGARHVMVLRGEASRLLRAIRPGAIGAVFADPARRGGEGHGSRRRVVLIEEYSPPFSIFSDFPSTLPILIKIAPAADAPPDWGQASVASAGECKELLLHRNLGLPALCAIDADTGARWTPALPLPPCPAMPSAYGPGPSADAPEPSADVPKPSAGVPKPSAYAPESSWLIEPHAAIIRTGAVAQYCREQGCEPLDPRIAYAWSQHEPPVSRWHQRFRILRFAQYQRRELQRLVDELGFGPLTEIKKRGFPDTPDEVRKKLKFRGTRPGVILLTRRGEQGHVMVFAARG